MKTGLLDLRAAEIAASEKMDAASQNLANARLAVKKHLAEFQVAMAEHSEIRARIACWSREDSK
jgi:flagellar basal body rod protein FlgG